MRRGLVPLALMGAVLLLFAGTLAILVSRAQPADPDVTFVTAERRDIVVKTVATGAIVPRVEVEIKSRVSGVLDELAVEPGDQVEAGDLIARVKIIPDSASLNNALANVKTARIELANARQELERAQALSAKAALSVAELQRVERDFALAEQAFGAARSNLQIVREGATRGSGNVLTEITSTVSGMVLAADVEEGETVTETNNFNAGTTIASVADMTDMVFEGSVDESEVGRIREGMGLQITVGAMADRRIAGTLEYISPKGELVEGAVQFAIRAAIEDEPWLFIRAASSATADIVLDRREGVVAIDEAALRFEGDDVFVDMKAGSGELERRRVEVGLSDGVYIEVEGLEEGEEAVANPTAPRE